jgi:hypothetical protein
MPTEYGGDVVRGEGHLNFSYGPTQRHARRSTGSVLANAGRERREYPDHSRDNVKRERLAAMTRDQLREVCKAQNVKGYSKMSKADLVEAALR